VQGGGALWEPIKDTLIKTYPGTHLLLAIPAKAGCGKTPKIQSCAKKLLAGMAHSAIPAKAGIQHK